MLIFFARIYVSSTQLFILTVLEKILGKRIFSFQTTPIDSLELVISNVTKDQ